MNAPLPQENRQIARDSLFVFAALRLDGEETLHRVKMRNLSARGMMAEGSVHVARGEIVWVELRNVGWTSGSVAWVQDNRFGIAFGSEIDPLAVRAPQSAPEPQEALVVKRPALAARARTDGPLRKI